MTRKERIAVIKECRKAVYDYARRLEKDNQTAYYTGGQIALGKIAQILDKKRARLEKKLKK